MGTLTAQILVGHGHRYHSGINPTHQLLLSENSRPSLILHSMDVTGTIRPLQRKPAVWIPTVEQMLEDALLMIFVLVFKHPEIRAAAEARFRGPIDSNLELYRDIEPVELRELHARCREEEVDGKCLLSIFEGSTLQGQVNRLRDYKCAIELCMSCYQREFSVFQNEFMVSGQLPRAAEV